MFFFSVINYQLQCSVGTFLGAAPRGLGKKLFIGRLPLEANADDLRNYFSRFGRVMDAYIPKVIESFFWGFLCFFLLVLVLSYNELYSVCFSHEFLYEAYCPTLVVLAQP
jgi:RNA recognition motif. (a.k.a. RRM, RBD, or RNP domain)